MTQGKPRIAISSSLLIVLGTTAAYSADISGRWRAEVETPNGVQKYLYTFQTDGEKLTGRAEVEGARARQSDLTMGRISGDALSFVEMVSFQGGELRIEYLGKLEGDAIRFSRKVGDFGEQEFVARREAGTTARQARIEGEEPRPPAGPPRAGGGPIVLEPDDKMIFPDPPAGFDAHRDRVPRGRVETIEYESKTVGTRRKMQVYTPPNYSSRKKYPVVYLLHGIGGDENEWMKHVQPNLILDNLIAGKRATPMIVVMPNGRAQANDRPEGNIYAAAPAFARFERDLVDDVIPAIEARYSVDKKRQRRALAGLSMGGGQSLNFGLAHLDLFAWVGAFSPAPNTKAPPDLVADPAAAARQLKLLYLSCGNKDNLIRISQGVHAYLKRKGVPHLWNVDNNGHNTPEWKSQFFHFSQRVFR